MSESPLPTGTVHLVGAGPGDPDLLTLRATRLIMTARIIVHDGLVDPAILAMARPGTRMISVAKQRARHTMPQDAINALLVAEARAGNDVVRLKGGDPFVFGRGGEELEVLRAHGIPFEVIPGITAAVACAAYAGIPLTHRDHAQSLRLLTAHAQDGDADHDWTALAQPQQTLAFYMGVSGLARLRDQLMAHGRAASTPFALVENGSRPEQRVIVGTLDELPELARRHAVQAPALLVIGEVAAFATQLHWFGRTPLTNADAGCADPALARAA